MLKLAIVSTHPVQYNAPWFSLLSQRGQLDVRVFYTWSQSEEGPKYDPDFRQVVTWDIPLLTGYAYEFVPNVSPVPGSHHFKGIDNPGLKQAIERWQPDHLLVIGWAYKSHLAIMRHFKGKLPVLFRGDSTLLDEKPGLKTILRRTFLTWVYRHVNTALYVGTNNKAYFEAHGLKPQQLVPAFHAVDNDRFAARVAGEEALLASWRSQLGFNAENFVVLFVGKFEEKKNPFFLLSLAKAVKNEAVRFVFVGGGPLEADLKKAAETDKRIGFLPFQNQGQMPAAYRLGNLFVLPSVGPGETWGLAANEAMAAGLPVALSAKVGGAVDLVRDNGVVFDPHDAGAVAAFVEKLAADAEAYRTAAATSVERVKTFSFLQICQAIEKACGVVYI